MEDAGKPVIRDLEALTKMAEQVVEGGAEALELDFSNTEIAFADRSEKELKKMARLFGLMNKHWLVGIGSKLGLAAIRMHLPFVESAVKYTIFEQFCGGTTLLETQKTIERLSASNIKTILDYGAEAKESEEEMNFTMNENIRGIDFAAHGKSVPIVSTKITGLARFELLESIQAGETLTPESKAEYKNVLRLRATRCRTTSVSEVDW